MTAVGEFGAWLRGMLAALRGERDSDVPCGTCTACCRSAQFVHVAPDETDTLGHLPRELLFPAPRMPRGHMVMGYDADGRCPMLGDAGCTIYEHRPRACRVYDCRIFTAAGVMPVDKPLVVDRARSWRFSTSGATSQAEQDAVRAAAAWLDTHPGLLGHDAPAPRRALAAIELHELFLDDARPDEEQVRARLAAAQRA